MDQAGARRALMTQIAESLRDGGELSTAQILMICAAISFAIVASLLTVAGFLVPDPASIPWMVVASRVLLLSAIWLIAIGGIF